MANARKEDFRLLATDHFLSNFLIFIHLKEELVPGVSFEGRVEELHFFRNLETDVKPILILPQQIDMLRSWKA